MTTRVLVILLTLLGAPSAPLAGEIAVDAMLYSLPTADGKGRMRLLVVIPKGPLFEGSAADSTTLRITAVATKGGRTLASGAWTGRAGRAPLASAGGVTSPVSDLRWMRTFDLPPGKARVSLLVFDLDRGNEAELTLTGEARDYSGTPLAVSDLVMGRCPEAPGSLTPQDGESSVLPIPRPVYGDAVPDPCGYVSVASAPEVLDEPLNVRWELRAQNGETVETGALETAPDRAHQDLVIRPDFERLSVGRHQLRVTVRRGDVSERRTADFEVDATRGARYADPRKLRTVLGYVATRGERDAIEQSPTQELPELWDQFWARRDPSPGTPTNEALSEFIRRVSFAERHFGGLDPGWGTDRGRVHILYGEPERVEYPNDATYRLPTEVWYYYDRGLEFVFQDVGLGDYRLQGPRRDR